MLKIVTEQKEVLEETHAPQAFSSCRWRAGDACGIAVATGGDAESSRKLRPLSPPPAAAATLSAGALGPVAGPPCAAPLNAVPAAWVGAPADIFLKAMKAMARCKLGEAWPRGKNKSLHCLYNGRDK